MIAVVKEDVAAVHAADDDMLQKVGEIKTGCSGHFAEITVEVELVNK